MNVASRFTVSLAAAWLVGSAAFAGSGAQAATIFDFTDFSNACGNQLTCVGQAQAAGTALRLTPSVPGAYYGGAGYSNTAVTLGAGATFSTTFKFQFTNPGGIDPADGIVFVLATNTMGIGGGGFGIGYAGLPGQSIGIEFDTFNNGGYDNDSSNHVAVDVNGALSNNDSHNAYGVATCEFANNTYLQPGCMSNGDVWSVTIGYDGTSKLLNVIVQDGQSAPQTVIQGYMVDIAGDLGTNQAFVGFTSATGAGSEFHDILSWQLASDIGLAVPPTPPTGVPEPLPITLLAIGFAGLLVRRRK